MAGVLLLCKFHSGFIYKLGVGQLCAHEINEYQGAGQQPAGRETHGDRDHFVADIICHYEQIQLPESHEAKQRNDHRHFAVACAAKGATQDVMYAVDQIEGGDHAQKQDAVFNNFRLGVKERHNPPVRRSAGES